MLSTNSRINSNFNLQDALSGIREQYASALRGGPCRRADKTFKPMGFYCLECYTDIDIAAAKKNPETRSEATALDDTMKKAWRSSSFRPPVVLCPCCGAELLLRRPNNLEEVRPVIIAPPEDGTTISLFRKEFRDGRLVTADIYMGRYKVRRNENRIILKNTDTGTLMYYNSRIASECYYSVRTPEQIIASLIDPNNLHTTNKKFKK